VSGVKPFLKWAGGKRQLLPHLRRYYPPRFGTYIEPFVGSAAVFFDLHNQRRLDAHDVLLADSSVDLVDCYVAVRDHVEDLIEALEALEAGHRARGEQHYYEVRDERYNPLRRQRGQALYQAPCPGVTPLASMLIYLNRTGYNGLFRVNASGDFNVPMGRYDRPRICDAANLRAASEALRAGVRIILAAFADSLASAREGDFVYLDPPYSPVSRTASFTAYTAAGFDAGAQEALRQTVVDLASRGVHVLLSNSATDEVKALYADNSGVRSAGLRTYLVPARRAINSRASRRGPVYEYVITNVGC
jgi:DNA adenine methylase